MKKLPDAIQHQLLVITITSVLLTGIVIALYFEGFFQDILSFSIGIIIIGITTTLILSQVGAFLQKQARAKTPYQVPDATATMKKKARRRNYGLTQHGTDVLNHRLQNEPSTVGDDGEIILYDDIKQQQQKSGQS